MTEPDQANPPRPTVFAVDCDRTLTGPDLVPDPEAVSAIARLRKAGIPCVLVTGRSREDLARFDLAEAFDAFALEGGAVWGPWNALVRPVNGDLAVKAADRVAAAGIDLERRTTSFSVSTADLDAVRPLAADCSLHVNVDRVDVLPPGLDKGVGLDGALATLGARSAHVIAIGDAENDLAMYDRADVCLAVANALPVLKQHADEVLAQEGPAAVVAAVERILKGDWRTSPPIPPAAA